MWHDRDVCFEPQVRLAVDLTALAEIVYGRCCRTSFSAPGFCLIDVGPDASSCSLRELMISLKREMQAIHQARTGADLVFLSAGRFDQQVTTKPHRDGGPDECFLMLGYEPSEVASQLTLFDYSKAALDLGMSPSEFLEQHNPMFQAGQQLLQTYATRVNCFSHRSYQILLINNSIAPYSSECPRWQGVLHTAKVINPCDSFHRVVNSTLVASVPMGTPETVSIDEQREFVHTTIVHRRGYDRQHLSDSTG